MNHVSKLKNCRKDIIYHYISFVAQRGMAEFNWSGENKRWIYSVVMERDVQYENKWKIDEIELVFILNTEWFFRASWQV